MLIDIEEIPFYVWAIFGLCIVLIVLGIILLATKSGRARREALLNADGRVHKMSDLSFGFDTLQGREDEPEEEPEEDQLPVFRQIDPTEPATPVGPYTSWDYRRESATEKQEATFDGYMQQPAPVCETPDPAPTPVHSPVSLSAIVPDRPEPAPSPRVATPSAFHPEIGLNAQQQLLLLKSHELLLTLTDGLKKVAAAKTDESRKEKLSELLAATKLLDTKNEWTEYKACFEKIHPGFWNKVENLANEEMTSYELRLSALLSLGMGTKEISDLTNRSVRTVETTIYKIRKKLGMESEEKTQDFLARLRNA